MIIVKLMGGLGNQMFQYAFGKSIARRLGVKLKIDLSFLADRSPKMNFTVRNYQLFGFQIQEDFASDLETKYHLSQNPGGIMGILFRMGRRFYPTYKYVEHLKGFDDKFETLPNGGYFEGYWQSERYFSEISNILRDEFRLKTKMSAFNAQYLKDIRTEHSVALHVRRGDYFSNKKTHSVHGLNLTEYYGKALRYCVSRIVDPKVFVFSDDIDWVKENISIPGPRVFVEPDFNRDYEQLILMSKCAHNITANSSFSWWAAWLNDNPQKIICSPKRWFADSSFETADRFPPSWILI